MNEQFCTSFLMGFFFSVFIYRQGFPGTLFFLAFALGGFVVMKSLHDFMERPMGYEKKKLKGYWGDGRLSGNLALVRLDSH